MCLLPSNVKLPTDPRAGGGNKDARQFFKQMTILYKVKTNSKNISFPDLCCFGESHSTKVSFLRASLGTASRTKYYLPKFNQRTYLPTALQPNIKKAPKEQNNDLKMNPIVKKNRPKKDPWR